MQGVFELAQARVGASRRSVELAWASAVTRGPAEFLLICEQLLRAIKRALHLRRCAWIIAGDVLQNIFEIGKRCTRILFDAASAPSPTCASGKSATTAPDKLFNIEFNRWSGVEAFLEFRPQPGELLAATLLMRDRRSDCGFADAIRAFAYLRGYEFLKAGL